VEVAPRPRKDVVPIALPDVVVNVKSAIVSRTLPTGTGTAFFTGVTERGSTLRARLLRSLSDFTDYCGARLAASPLYDAAETFFAEGGTLLYVGRVFGAGAVAATRNLLDAGAGVSLVVTAGTLGDPDPGTWGNSLTVEVVAVTGGFQINVYRSAVLVESSYTLVTQADAIAWARNNSKYIVIALGATALVPAAAGAAALSSGTDGSAVADADWQLGLNLFGRSLGPGQVAAPGRTTSAGQLQLLDHAQSRNRFALLDLPDSSSRATLVAAAQALYTAPNNGRRYGQPFAPWDVVPGLTALTQRTVPPCARAAAQYARVDALGNPNQAAAGRNGVARFALDLSQPGWIDSDRQALNEAGVTVSRRRFGNAIVTYGMRTLADQVADAQWSMSPNVRCVMAYVARALAIGEAHEFDQVDGQGHALSDFRGELMAAANDLFAVGALYGATPAEAFAVDTGPAINTPTTLAAGEMHAQVALRTSPSAERVVIDVVKTPITQAL
jgi:hypothetical protein